MRPLLVDLGREYRGGQHQALLLLRGLRARGHAAELMALRDSALAARAREIGVPVHGVASPLRQLVAARQIHTLLRKSTLDLIHANEPHALTAACLARANRFKPLVVSRRIPLPQSRGRSSLARYRAAARLITVSHFVERSVLACRLAPEKVSVIYDGVVIPPETSRAQRENVRARLGVRREAVCIGNVAAYVAEKGHALLLEAFARVRTQFPTAALLLRGEGPEFSKLRAQARNLRLADAIQFLPADTEIETLFAAIDVFAFPSHEEPLGSALLAAMAHGLPVAALARGGIPEVLEDGKNGLLTGDLDSNAFADALAGLLSRPEEAARLGQAARETVVARFSADRMVEETLRLYELVVAGDS